MVVPEPNVIFPDRSNKITFHNLHVVDVVQQLHPRRTDGLTDPDSSGRPVALVVGMIDLAVQQLQVEIYAFLFCKILHS